MIADYRHRGKVTKPRRKRSLASRLLRLVTAFVLVVAVAYGVRVAAGWVAATDLFRMERTAVRGLAALTPEAVVEAAAVEPGTNLFRIDIAEVESRIAALDRVKTVRVKRALPRTLSILVVERTPVALVMLDRMHEVDSEGFLMRTSDAATLPDLLVITGVDRDDFGHEVNDKSRALLRLLSDLRRLQNDQPWLIDTLSDVRVTGDGSLEAHAYQGGVRIMLGHCLDPTQLGILHTILNDLDRIKADVESIDLRFRKQGILRIS